MTRAHDTAAKIEQQAAAWVARIDLKGTPANWADLDDWLGQNPRHRAAFLRLSVGWRRADALKNLAVPGDAADPDLLDPARWSREDDEADATESSTTPLPDAQQPEPIRPFVPEPRPTRISAPWVSRLAAGLAAIGFIAAVGVGARYALHAADAQTYSTEIGEFRRVPLADGSTIALNTNSKVTVRYTPSHREVELDRGEALFTVAHNTQRPFDVHAGDTVVRAVGTEFDVRLRDASSVDVLVSEGRISINPPSRSTLAAGGVATVRNGHVSASTVSLDDISHRLSWLTGRLVFQGETLGEVVGEFNRYNSRVLLAAESDAANLRIGGTFQATDPEGFATALGHAFHVHATHQSRPFGVEVIRLDGGTP